uniref:Uncharacterized protein n=1 Tax=Parascaris univalens TaxID=6257 RepID=A0A915ASU0_PARUN
MLIMPTSRYGSAGKLKMIGKLALLFSMRPQNSSYNGTSIVSEQCRSLQVESIVHFNGALKWTTLSTIA